MLSEHRDHRRVEFERRAWCEQPNLTLYLPVSNVSLGGMFLQTSTPFEPGEALKISFDARDGQEAIVAEVEVVWSCRAGRASGVGCRVVSFLTGADAYSRLVDSLASA